MARSQQQDARDAQYRAALGLAPGEALPAQLGTVGGSRGGHGATGARINLGTNGRPAAWHTEARRAAARRTVSAIVDELVDAPVDIAGDTAPERG